MTIGSRVRDLLDAWREAERRWEATALDDPGYAVARGEVLAAWLAYQAMAGSVESDEVILVADNEMRYVAANDTAHRVLGYPDGEIVGLSVADLTLPAERERMVDLWRDFRLAGRQEGEYILRTKDGAPIRTRYVARAHFPAADLHTSRLTVAGPQDGEPKPAS